MTSESQPEKDTGHTPPKGPPPQQVTMGYTPSPPAPATPGGMGPSGGGPRGPLTEADIAEALQQAETLEDKIRIAIEQVYDPEIPVNIYELGLVYDVQVDEHKNVKVIMTLTSPACPAAQEIPLNVQRQVGRIAEVGSVEVDITFDPPWSPDKMSDVAKLTLGMM